MANNYYDCANHLVPSIYLQQASNAKRSRESKFKDLIQHKKFPEHSWRDNCIEQIVMEISSMDSNNFSDNCGVGEREARIACSLVAKRHYGFGHGIGRSGDLNEAQPKAAGSSLMSSLTNSMLKDLIITMGVPAVNKCILVPVATGMSLVLVMLSLKAECPNAKYVLWSRIDQKSCFKSIITAGCIPVIIDTIENGTELVTNIKGIENCILELGQANILCVFTTTSCFAPRASDNIENVAKLCKDHSIPHIINNAYGLQSYHCMNKIQQAHTFGRVDAFIQSADKNLMVPVGAAIIASSDQNIIDNISKIYPGRASASPLLDVFMTLLSLGKLKYLAFVKERKELFKYLKHELGLLAHRFGESIIESKNNAISIAMTLKNVPPEKQTLIGSMLFIRGISGARVISNLPTAQNICGYEFKNWGGHNNNLHSNPPYITAAAGIGVTRTEVDTFIKKLDKILAKVVLHN